MLSEERDSQTPAPRSMTPWMALSVVLLAAGLLVLAVIARRSPPGDPGAGVEPDMGANHPAVGKQLDRLQLQPLTGEPPELSAADLHGRVTLINFWGPWCPPCRIEFPHLAELERHYRDSEDFRFVSVSCSNEPGSDEHMAGETEEFLKQQEADFATYRDADGVTRGVLQRLAGEFAYPTTLVVGRDGAVRAYWLGYAPGVERQMRQVVDEALAEATPVGPPS